MLTPAQVFEDIGGFDQRFFMYYEDIDYCWKCTQAGLRNYYVPVARIVHHGSGSSRREADDLATHRMLAAAAEYFHCHQGRRAAVLFRILMGIKATTYLLLLRAAGLIGGSEGVKTSLQKWSGILRFCLDGTRWAAINSRPETNYAFRVNPTGSKAVAGSPD